MFRAHAEEGLPKLMYSDQVASGVQPHMELITDPAGRLVKSASTIFGVPYEKLAAPAGHVGIHTVALGDFETYGFNRNADSFPKAACQRYHDTFVKNGHVFVGHNNRDPKYAVGKIAASAYNEPMGRIELYLHVDEKKASDQLHRLERDGDHPFSMACKVPFDRCNKCNTLRKSASDPNQCEHVRDSLGDIWKDGTAIGVHNDHPGWFDESFVTRPADRIAWDLKVASHGGTADPVKLASASELFVPDCIEDSMVPGYRDKRTMVQKLARFEREFLRLAEATRRESSHDRYLWELRKAAAWDLDDVTVDGLRQASPEDAFATLARRGVVMGAPTFFKYALGARYGELADDMPNILGYIHSGLFSTLEKAGAYRQPCRNCYFDVDTRDLERYSVLHNYGVSADVTEKVAEAGAFVGPGVDQRIIESTVLGRQPELNVVTLSKAAADDQTAHRAAEIYAAYKLSALDAMLRYHKQANTERLLALAAAQSLT